MYLCPVEGVLFFPTLFYTWHFKHVFFSVVRICALFWFVCFIPQCRSSEYAFWALAFGSWGHSRWCGVGCKGGGRRHLPGGLGAWPLSSVLCPCAAGPGLCGEAGCACVGSVS